MHSIKFKEISEDTLVLQYNDIVCSYDLLKDFKEPYISFRICNQILTDLRIDTDISLLMKLTSSNIFIGINDFLTNESGKELSIQESLQVCVNFINIVVLKINNDFSNITKEMVSEFNNFISDNSK